MKKKPVKKTERNSEGWSEKNVDLLARLRETDALISVLERKRGGGEPLAGMLKAKGEVLLSLGILEDAEEPFLRALSIFEEIGEKGEKYLDALVHLAHVHKMLGRREEAADEYERVVGLHRINKSPAYSMATFIAYNNLGLIRREDLDFAEAEKLYRDSLAMLGSDVAKKDKALLALRKRAVVNLATLLNVRRGPGDCREAEEILRKMLVSEMRMLPLSDDAIILTLILLGNALLSDGRPDEVFDLFFRFVEKIIDSGERPPNEYQCFLRNLARLRLMRGDLEGASTEFRRAFRLVSLFGARHPETLTARVLALVVDSLHEETHPGSELLECVSIIRSGSDYVNTRILLQTVLCNVGVFFQTRRNHKEALRLLLEAKGLFQRSKSENVTEYAVVLNNVGFSLHATGRRSEGMEHYKQALGILEKSKTITADHPFRMTVLDNIATLYRELGNERKSEETRRNIGETIRDGEYVRSFRFQEHLLHHFLMLAMRDGDPRPRVI